jgi:hypothetical protein
LNTGTIEGSSFYVIIGGAGADRVINQGTISGGINLGAGNNYYDGRGGTHNGYIKPGFSSEIGHIGSAMITTPPMAVMVQRTSLPWTATIS